MSYIFQYLKLFLSAIQTNLDFHSAYKLVFAEEANFTDGGEMILLYIQSQERV